DVGEVGQTIAEVDQVTASATTHKDLSRSDKEINGGMVDGRQKEPCDMHTSQAITTYLVRILIRKIFIVICDSRVH
ncbi:unnamed protein product, partial [Brassica oleracea]